MTMRRPEIFISTCSADLRTVREEVKRAVDAIGCHGVYQESFPPDYGTVADMLRRHIEVCDAVIHIAGKCYGAEPRDRPPTERRVSYTQMEYYLARELNKKLYVFVATDQFPFDPCAEESEDKQSLQRQHCQMLLGDVHLREKVDSRERLAIRVRELRETLEELRQETVQVSRRLRVLAAIVAAAVVATVYFGWKFRQSDRAIENKTVRVEGISKEAKTQSAVAEQKSEAARETSIAAKQAADEAKLKADQAFTLLEVLVGELRYDGPGPMIADVAGEPTEADVQRRTDAALDRLTKKKGISREELDRQIRDAVDQILQSSDASPYAKALAAFSATRYEEAERWAEQAIADIEKEAALLRESPKDATEVKVRAALLAKYKALLLSGDALFAQKIYSESEAQYRAAVELMPREENGPEWDVAVEKQASVLWRLERYPEAETLFRAIYDYRLKAYGETDPRTAGCLNAIGTSLTRSGRTQEAVRYLQDAISFSEAAFGRESWQVSVARTNLGHALMAMNRYDDAREAFVEAMRVRKNLYGDSHVETALAINDLAGLDVQMGRRSEAIAGFRQALAIFEKNLGADAPELVMVLNNLAENLFDQGDSREAEECARRALSIARAKTGVESQPTARSLGNLARAIHLRDPEGAVNYSKEALCIHEKLAGVDSDAVGVDCSDLGNVLSDLERWQEADAYYERAERIARKRGPLNSVLAVTLNNRARMWMAQEEWARAQPLLVQAVDIQEAVHGQEFSGLVTLLSNLASVEEELNHTEICLAYLHRAVAIARKSYGENAIDTGEMWHKLGWTLYRDRRTIQAELPIRHALKIHEAQRGTVSVQAGHCLYALVEILNETRRWPASVAIAKEALAVAGSVQRETGKAVYYDQALREAAGLAFSSQGWNASQIAQAIQTYSAAAPSHQPLSDSMNQWLGALPPAP